MQGAQVADQVVSYVGEFVLGGIAILGLAVAYWAIKGLKQAHKEHVEALEKAAGQHVEMHKAYQESNTQTIIAITRLTDTEKVQTTAIQSNTTALVALYGIKEEMVNLRRSVDDVIRDAVRRRSSDRYPAVKIKDDRS